jgi:hypothetical protein
MDQYYLYDNYRTLLADTVKAKKNLLGKSFTSAKLAEKLRMQRTNLSSILNGRAHFSQDQLFLAMEFLNMSSDEREFIELIYQHATSEVKKRKQLYAERIEIFRAEKLRAKNFVGAKHTTSSNHSDLQELFLNIDAQLIHVFLTLPKYKSDPARIRSTLNLSEDSFKSALGTLEKIGLIKINGSEIQVLADDFHLSNDSPILPYYKMLTRQKALQLIQSDHTNQQFGFSAFFSADEKTKQVIHGQFLKFIEFCREESLKSKSEDVYQINFDLLKWSNSK